LSNEDNVYTVEEEDRRTFLCTYVEYLKHVEYVRDPGPGVVGRVHEKADDLKIPDEAHAQE
jgi:hypothetical protein